MFNFVSLNIFFTNGKSDSRVSYSQVFIMLFTSRDSFFVRP